MLSRIVILMLLVMAGAGRVHASSAAAQLETDLYDPDLALRLLHLAGAAYCPKKDVQAWNCSFCTELPNFQTAGVEHNLDRDM